MIKGNLLCLLIPGVLLLYCCRNYDNRKTAVPFTKEIPTDTKGKQLFESIKPIRDSLKLDTLENGYDSFQVRIWMGVHHNQEVIIIKNNKHIWSATFTTFAPILNDKQDSVLYYKKESVHKNPKEDWNDFINKLRNYQIFTLSDQDKLANYDHPFDGLNLAFEISTINGYRIYSYHAPQVNLQLPEAKNVVDILNLIKEDFDVKLLE